MIIFFHKNIQCVVGTIVPNQLIGTTNSVGGTLLVSFAAMVGDIIMPDVFVVCDVNGQDVPE